jgi:hypothetical protein
MPKSQLVTVEAQDNGLKHTWDEVDANGKVKHSASSARFDGKDYAMTGDPTQDSAALKKVDGYSYEHWFKQRGKEVARWHITVAKDGKSATASGSWKDENGKTGSANLVYDCAGGRCGAGPAADPFQGVWILNVAKSKFSPGMAPKVTTWTFHGDEHLDGRDYPLQNHPSYDTVSATSTGVRTREFVAKRGGKVVGKGRETVSSDGRTLTRSWKATNQSGQEIWGEEVYEKK